MKFNAPIIFAAMALSAIAPVFTTTTLSQQQASTRNHPPHGKLIDVGGHRLHINCTGQGSPTIVMESGAGDFSFDWSLVQPEVSRFTRVCTYDRAGYAWSDPGPTPRTLQQITYELHAGLKNAGVDAPYVLVGHSLGGLIVRVYAGQYPKEVAGMVLVDSSWEDQLISVTDRDTRRDKIVRWRSLSRGREIPPIQPNMPSSTGSTKVQEIRSSFFTDSKVESPFDKLPSNVQEMRLWAKSQPNLNPARFSEFDFIAEELERMHLEGKKLGDIPLVVLTRGIGEYAGADEQTKIQFNDDYERRITALTALSSNSKQIVAKNSGHHIQLEDPKLVIDAIQLVINASLRHTKLTQTP